MEAGHNCPRPISYGMKIILATPIYPPEIGGPATYVKELSARIHDKHEVTVVAFTDNLEPFPGTKLVAISKLNPLPVRLWKYFWALMKEAKNADVILVQNAMAAGLPVALVKIFRGTPFVIRMVGDEAWERAEQQKITNKTWEEFIDSPDGGIRSKIMMIVQRFVLKRANFIMPPSEYNRNLVIKAYGVDPKKIIVNYTATEEPEIIEIEANPKPHQIVTVARLISLKKIDEIIKGMKTVLEKYPDANLVIAGEGPEMQNLKNLTKELGLENSVEFLGKISRAETWQLRKNSSVYIINSTHESLPISVLTSLSSGIPIIATNVSGIREVVYHEKTGLLVESGDIEGIAKSIIRFFEDENLRKSVVENGKILLKERFSWEVHLSNLNKLLSDSLKKTS